MTLTTIHTDASGTEAKDKV